MFRQLLRAGVVLRRPEDRRAARRDPVEFSAFIHLPDHVIASRTINLSASGACLIVAPVRALPSSFAVRIPDRALSRRARLVWRRGDQCGIEFLSSPG